MKAQSMKLSLGLAATLVLILSLSAHAQTPVDRSAVHPDSGIVIRHEDHHLTLSWPLGGGGQGRLVLDLRPGAPLIVGLAVAPSEKAEPTNILTAVDPVTFLTVGTRESPADRPPTMSVFNVFFDTPANRPHQQFRARLDLKTARVTARNGRATVSLGDVTAGPFKGRLEITVYAGTRLVHVETVLSTTEPNRAFLYDTGLASRSPDWNRIAWFDTEGTLKTEAIAPDASDKPLAVLHRAIAAETPTGSVACFPPPHQFFFPRDLTDNQKTAWSGRDHRGLDDRSGFGVRQTETGGGSYVPWFDAPPGTDQRLGVFYLLSAGKADQALAETLKFTHGDAFPDLPGHVRFTSHWHMEIAIAAMREKAKNQGRSKPDFVKMFKNMNVDIVHLAEFHGEGHPRDPGPTRLTELTAMFDECQRLSDGEILFLPGEEANSQVSVKGPGRETGHWLYLFPRPVYWTMNRAKGQPFADTNSPGGKTYHVGGPDDLANLLTTERGLAWTAHPRIKASNWTPDSYRDEPLYQSDRWLGAAWKAMPADLSSPRLGSRVLNLLDDMANWGQHKYALGEVDVFKIDHTHELYGHMNVNYLRLDKAPRHEDDWSPVLDALRAGKFFVTTGEVLLTDFTVAGRPSGSTVSLATDPRPEVKLTLQWTFPMRFAEVISGDGTKVYRDPIDLTDTPAFGTKTLTLHPDLAARKWVRVEAWDVAANGAFSQPVWLNVD